MHDPNEKLARLVEVDGVQVPAVLVEVFGESRLEEVRAEADLKHYKDFQEFMMHLLLAGALHAFPDASTEDAIEIARIMANSLRMPNARPLWNRAANYVNRVGLSQMIMRLSMELTRGIYKVK
jgi:hypothetical protein